MSNRVPGDVNVVQPPDARYMEPRDHEEIRRDIRMAIIASDGTAVDLGALKAITRMLGLLVESNLLVVEAVDRLTESNDKHAGKTASAIDYISDHLNEVGQPP